MHSHSRLHRVFAYGSNLDPQRFQFRARNWNGCYQLGSLLGYELRFNKRSLNYGVAANVVPHPTRRVWGIVVELNDADLEAIDRCEGYPTNYNRVPRQFLLADNSEVEGYVYMATSAWIVEGKYPNSEYLGYVTRGAIACGLPENYIQAIARLGRQNV